MQNILILLVPVCALLLICGFFAYYVFITEKGKADRAIEIAERANRIKKLFVSRMNREIRAPVNAIVGMTCMGRASEDLERKNYCLDNIENTSKNVLGIVNDMLDICKIESNKLELSYSNFNLDKMLARVLRALSGQIEDKKLRLILSAEQDVPEMLYTDEQRLNQVITSILNNAIRNTPDGGAVYLFVRKPAHTGEVFTLQFEIRDNGAGMSEDQASRLFNLSDQIDDCILRKNDNGLSLAVSKRLIELLGGNITLRSAPGQGSSYMFDICSGIMRSTAQKPQDEHKNGLSFGLAHRAYNRVRHPDGRGNPSLL